MNRAIVGDALQRTLLVNGLAEEVEHAAENRLTDRDRHRRSGVEDRHAADEAVGRAQRYGAHPVAAEVLPVLSRLHDQRVVDVGELTLRELGIQGRADHLDDLSFHHAIHRVLLRFRATAPGSCYLSASTPPMSSAISFVI